jgi:glycosyltransferase involved in cell wall biosynthesis
VLHLNTERTWRGGERQTLYTLSGLRDADCEVTLLARRGCPLAERVRAEGVEVVEVASHAAAAFWLAVNGRSWDLLHAQTAKTHSLAFITKPFHRKPVIYTRRVNFPKSGPFERWKYRNTEAVVAISRAIRQTLKGTVGLENVEVIPSTYRKRELNLERARKLKEDLQVGDRKVIGTMGDLVPQKDPETMIATVSELMKRRDDVVFLHFGNQQMGKLVKNRILLESITDRVHLLGHVEDVEDYFAILDIYLATSNETEGLLSAVLDAFVYRVPVVSTLAGGMLDSVANRGLTAPPREPVSLAHQVERLLEDPSLGEELVERAEREVHEIFGPDKHASRYMKLYHEVLER